jgi:hypothetical protein
MIEYGKLRFTVGGRCNDNGDDYTRVTAPRIRFAGRLSVDAHGTSCRSSAISCRHRPRGNLDKIGVTTDQLRAWLDRHAKRARYAERSITLLYGAIVVFVSTCLSIALDRAVGGSLSWLPVAFAVAGTLLLLCGGTYMVAESRLSGEQINIEIGSALCRLEKM